jgi:hypothetical protein
MMHGRTIVCPKHVELILKINKYCYLLHLVGLDFITLPTDTYFRRHRHQYSIVKYRKLQYKCIHSVGSHTCTLTVTLLCKKQCKAVPLQA